jgi:hypothetical protein
MDIREWWGTPSAAWGVFVFGIGGGTLITSLVSPKIGIPVGSILSVIGVYLLIRAYRHRDKRLDEPRAKCKKGDHSWFNDKCLEGVAYKCESLEHEHDSFGGTSAKHLRKTCYFCKHSEDEAIF